VQKISRDTSRARDQFYAFERNRTYSRQTHFPRNSKIYQFISRVAYRVRQHNTRNNDGDTCGRAIGSRPVGKIALPPIIRFSMILYIISRYGRMNGNGGGRGESADE